MNMMKYKDYLGTVEYTPEDHCLYGKIAYIRDLVNYEATTVAELEVNFKEAVDDYIESCMHLGIKPQKPFKGSFNVRAGSDLHRAAVMASGDTTLNAFVCDAIKEKLERSGYSI